VGEIRNTVLTPGPGNLISCGQPIIAMVAVESETARVIGEAGCGIVVQPGGGGGILLRDLPSQGRCFSP